MAPRPDWLVLFYGVAGALLDYVSSTAAMACGLQETRLLYSVSPLAGLLVELGAAVLAALLAGSQLPFSRLAGLLLASVAWLAGLSDSLILLRCRP